MNFRKVSIKNVLIKSSIITGSSYAFYKIFNCVDKKYVYKIHQDKSTNNAILTSICTISTLPIQFKLANYLDNYFGRKKKNNGGILKKFGMIGFTIYMSYWVITGIFVYYLVKNKYINKEKLEVKIKESPFKNYYEKLNKNIGDKGSDFILAYFINGVLEIVRLPTFLLFMKKIMK